MYLASQILPKSGCYFYGSSTSVLFVCDVTECELGKRLCVGKCWFMQNETTSLFEINLVRKWSQENFSLLKMRSDGSFTIFGALDEYKVWNERRTIRESDSCRQWSTRPVHSPAVSDFRLSRTNGWTENMFENNDHYLAKLWAGLVDQETFSVKSFIPQSFGSYRVA